MCYLTFLHIFDNVICRLTLADAADEFDLILFSIMWEICCRFSGALRIEVRGFIRHPVKATGQSQEFSQTWNQNQIDNFVSEITMLHAAFFD